MFILRSFKTICKTSKAKSTDVFGENYFTFPSIKRYGVFLL